MGLYSDNFYSWLDRQFAAEREAMDENGNGFIHPNGEPCKAKSLESCPILKEEAKTDSVNPKKGNSSDGYEFNDNTPEEFASAIQEAKKNCVKPEFAWRVEAKSESEYRKKGKKLLTTEKGSCVAVEKDGDIVSVAKRKGDETSAGELLRKAVQEGGDRLDSFDGNWALYCYNGFEPVSWTRWNDKYSPDGWDEAINPREDVIFFKYTGKKGHVPDMVEWKESHKPYEGDDGYSQAKAFRDSQI